jgi:uncharacterized protein YndB with AHSA1/START domain
MATLTDREYDAELRKLHDQLLLMGAKVEEMIANSMRALTERDSELARRMIEMRWEEHGVAQARIERVEPMSAFAFRWAPFQDPGGVEPTGGNSTRVEFALSGDEERTLVKVTESGFDSLDCSPEQRARNLEENAEGWRLELGHLRDYAVGQLA